MDLIEDSPGNTPEFSVSELSGAVKRVVEGEFSFVRVRGEVGRVSRPRSGHVYLDLKDDRAVLAGVIWKGRAQALATQPEEGMEVVATGRLTTFPGQSRYQIVIEDMAPAGVGALMAMLEKRKKALEAEGLFDPARKRPLPYLPEVIGVVTSPSGAVIRDILHRLRDRFPRKVLVWPVAVQGQTSAAEVARAIAGFNAMTPGGALPRPDLLIVARGGGSIEDLWGFNEEIVARAVAAGTIPLISAVGHETDTTLIDYVADRRAPTPTAAAEMAVPVRLDLLAGLEGQGARLARALEQGITARNQRLRDLSRALPRPDVLLSQASQRFDLWADRLPGALSGLIARRRVRLSEVSGLLRPSVLSRQVAEAKGRVSREAARLAPALTRVTARMRERFDDRARRLRPEPIQRDIVRRRADLDRLSERLAARVRADMADRGDRLRSLDRLRETLGYRETLRRGYAVVRDGEGAVLTTPKAARAAARLEIEFAEGRVEVGPGGRAPKPARKPEGGGEQGSLF